ncbi:hypothetical protein ACU21_04190 [Actinobaculum suis]|nr:hypothetical protein ACU21_04190 [Actinobaculum suis]
MRHHRYRKWRPDFHQLPLHPEFISAAKQISGCWNSGSKTWNFKDDYREKIHELLASVHGWRTETTAKWSMRE